MRRTVGQLNTLIRLQRCLNISSKKVLINSQVVSDVNYYPLVWMFSKVKSYGKIEGFHKRALRFHVAKHVFI